MSQVLTEASVNFGLIRKATAAIVLKSHRRSPRTATILLR
jgi:hypothetical protein